MCHILLYYTVLKLVSLHLVMDFPDSWQLYFFIPGSILIDIGLLILVFAISLDARHTVQKPDKIVLSLALIIPGVILNYILGWIAYLIKTMI